VNKYILILFAAVAAGVNAATTGTNVAPAASATNAVARTAARTSGSDFLWLGIWVAVAAVLFGFLWRKGYLEKIRNYVRETQEELKKCTWPSRDDLKGSTVVVMITIVMLGLFTVGVDWILSNLIRLIT
jgi:preprotein translocase SecE subunit